MSPPVENPSFEEAGATLGSAADWSTSVVSSEEVFADYGLNQQAFSPDTASVETFEEGWFGPVDSEVDNVGPEMSARTSEALGYADRLIVELNGVVVSTTESVSIPQQLFVSAFLYPAVVDLEFRIFGPGTAPDDTERYESDWGVVDATRLARLWPVGSPPDYQFTLSPGLEEADYDTSDADPGTPETFAVGWGEVLTTLDPITGPQLALYDGATEDHETFETGWGQEAAPSYTDAAYGSGKGDPAPTVTFEPFEDANEEVWPSVEVLGTDAPTDVLTTADLSDPLVGNTPIEVGYADPVTFEAISDGAVLPTPLTYDTEWLASQTGIGTPDPKFFYLYANQNDYPGTRVDITAGPVGRFQITFNPARFWTRVLNLL